MIGLGRMGANMVRRLLKAGHQCVVFDTSAKAVEDESMSARAAVEFLPRAPTAPRTVGQ
jgi:6-phosphogluconate dehydrogenase